MIKSSQAMISKMLEVFLAVKKHNLEAFRKASRGMNTSMKYRMANMVKQVMKSHKGAHNISVSFTKVLDNIGGFQKDKIPISLIRKMYQKGYISHSAFNQADGYKTLLHNLSLRKSNFTKYSEFLVRLCEAVYVQAIRDRKEEKRGHQQGKPQGRADETNG